MAIVIKSNSKLRKKVKIYNIIFFILFSAFFLILLISNSEPFLLYLGIDIVLLIILNRKTKIDYRGYHGEKKVFNKLKKLPEDYYIFNDINIDLGEKKAQIDHVIVHNSGIWCVETKSHKGWIFGRENDRNWTQTKFSSKNNLYKNKIYNPVRQNKVHCERIKEFLQQRGFNKIIVFPIVVFTSIEKMNIETITPVLTLKDLANHIKDYSEEYNYTNLEKNKIARILAENENIELEEYYD